MVKYYNKLVRDKMPAIIEADGNVPDYMTLPAGAHFSAIKSKIAEEAKEFIESGTVEELADLLEAIKAAADYCGGIDNLIAVTQDKKKKRGGFVNGVWLFSVSGDNLPE